VIKDVESILVFSSFEIDYKVMACTTISSRSLTRLIGSYDWLKQVEKTFRTCK